MTSPSIAATQEQREQEKEEKLDAPPVPWMHGAAGIAGGAISMTLFYPLDLIRTRQHTFDGTNTSRLRGIQQIFRQDGFKGFYRGVGVAVASHSIGWGTYLTLFRTAQGGIKTFRGFDSSLGDFLAACCAACFTATLVTPLNLMKTRKQLHDQKGSVPKGGIFSGLREVMRNEGGVRALFKGVGPQILLSMHTTIQVAMYEFIKRNWWEGQEAPVLGVAAASGFSKAFAAVICNPLEVCRTRLQDKKHVGETNSGYTSMRSAFRTIWRTEGIRGMYRGSFVNVCRVVPTTMFAFVLYEKFVVIIHIMHSNRGNEAAQAL